MTDTDLLPCWYVKDYADGWIKYHDGQVALREAENAGAIMVYSADGSTPSITRANDRGDAIVGYDMAAEHGEQSCLMIGERRTDGTLEIQHCVYGAEAEALYRALNQVPALAETLKHPPQPSPQSDMVAVPRDVVALALSMLRECKSDYCHPYFTDRHGTGPKLKEAIEMLQPYTKGSE